ncbi:bacillithiol biosynthesis cysteine-adding enzyme BshC [Flavobacterium sp.]|uniref:bacillithiol biosynthesis cysteine-adding enzyme BshC n=1 Tax=Flavobacterium sp. TaxID=239 RepID=UPI00261C5467|nr:bacillithiol biosynthesis cysteine-adding enzyme BshC [Flavobacterium sp.]MDD2986342.1 bacillithiol biosynthesis cysteine-adding enzyme BshC [Flavobacterium sp.]
MPNDCISYQKSGYFSKLMIDYLEEKTELKVLYNRFPKLENFKSQIEEKKINFNDNSNQKRQILVATLQKQYKSIEASPATLNNIKLLNHSNTFTVTTGHQLNLFTGPLYFLYKIISTINLCEQLKTAYPNQNFVPIYWMATEDHDFEEINHFWFKGKKVSWQKESLGPVGRLSTEGLETVFEQFSSKLGLGENTAFLKNLFQKGYVEYSNLADATRFIANELFKEKGLVILDGDDANLKRVFIPYAKEELVNQTSSNEVLKTNELLSEYKVQVNPREINLFYIEDNLRERIVFENNKYSVLNTNYSFSESEILVELENNPEKFSPNVILRPLYQEVILPNLCYIGGGGELAYWLELKSNFEANKVAFPMLLLRNSVLIATEKQVQKADKLELTWGDLFSKQGELLTNKTKTLSNLEIDFSVQKAYLKKQFEDLHEIAIRTDKSFIGAVKAQEIKQIKGLENLEKRLLKAEKRVLADKLERITSLQNELFPNQSLQERKANFSEYYLEFGKELIDKLFEDLKPLEDEFKVLVL